MRVIGHARYDERKPFILAFTVEPITKADEIGIHFLEAIKDTLLLEKRKEQTLATQSVPLANESSEGTSSDLDDNSSEGQLTKVQRDILRTVRRIGNASNDGISRNAIKFQLPGINRFLVDSEIDFLVNEGFIYSIDDEDNFMALDD